VANLVCEAQGERDELPIKKTGRDGTVERTRIVPIAHTNCDPFSLKMWNLRQADTQFSTYKFEELAEA